MAERIETKLREVGEDLYKDTVALFDELELSKNSKQAKILMLTGPTATKEFGEKLKEGIQKISRYKIIGPFVVYKADSSTINEAVELAQNEDVVATFGVGSGKVCDTNKKVGHDASTPQKSVYIINGLTTPSNDGFASPVVSIKDERHKLPYSIRVSPPHGILIYREMVVNSPLDLIRAGFGDLSDKVLACYEWERETKLYKEGAIEEIEVTFDKRVSQSCVDAQTATFNIILGMKETGMPFDRSNPLLGKGILSLTYSLYGCGKAMSSLIPYSSRPCSGSGHVFSHILDGSVPNPARHGEQVASGSKIGHFLVEKYLGEKPFGLSYGKLKEVLDYVFNTGQKITDAERLRIEPKYMINAVPKAIELSRKRPRLTTFNYLSDFHEPKVLIDQKFVEEMLKEIYII